jgi:hypothetical protein
MSTGILTLVDELLSVQVLLKAKGTRVKQLSNRVANRMEARGEKEIEHGPGVIRALPKVEKEVFGIARVKEALAELGIDPVPVVEASLGEPVVTPACVAIKLSIRQDIAVRNGQYAARAEVAAFDEEQIVGEAVVQAMEMLKLRERKGLLVKLVVASMAPGRKRVRRNGAVVYLRRESVKRSLDPVKFRAALKDLLGNAAGESLADDLARIRYGKQVAILPLPGVLDDIKAETRAEYAEELASAGGLWVVTQASDAA